MPKGPRGEKRPADAIGAAIMVGRIATGEVSEERKKDSPAAELGRKGGHARATNLSPTERATIAKTAAAKRWSKKK